MPATKQLRLETVNFDDPKEVDAFLAQVIAEGMKGVRAETAELQAKGLMDAEGNLLTDELPEDMREGSQRDFGG